MKNKARRQHDRRTLSNCLKQPLTTHVYVLWDNKQHPYWTINCNSDNHGNNNELYPVFNDFKKITNYFK